MEDKVFSRTARAMHKGEAETWKDTGIANTLNTFDLGEVRCNELAVQAIENHPNDSRVKMADVFQALTERMGTGGGQHAYGIRRQSIWIG